MAGASSIFMSCMLILLIFNAFYIMTYPASIIRITIGAIVGFLAAILAVGGLAIFGGLFISGAAVKIVFGAASILNILFQINLGYNLPVGMGLASNILSLFPSSEFLGIGYIVVTFISLIAFVSGLMVIAGGAAV
jgi:hypothetical protein